MNRASAFVRRFRALALAGALACAAMLAAVLAGMLEWPWSEAGRCRSRQAQVLRQELYRLVPDRADDAAARYCARNGNRVIDPAARFRVAYGARS